MYQTTNLVTAIRVARQLNDPLDVNDEYARSQAELICDAFSMPGDFKDAIIAVITHRVDPVQAWLDTLAELAEAVRA